MFDAQGANGVKRKARLVVTVLLLALPYAAPADMGSEIQHLLRYVESSGCQFERNNSVYDSEEARAHIERKYSYVKPEVKETEDFIKYAATESSMTGRKYYVICNGRKQASSEWLHNEPARYRNRNPVGTAE
ncbi:MAG: DUF5329 domain-containing protein [Pseudomonadota bacterium]